MMNGEVDAIVAQLDAIDGTGDPEADHGEADRILLAAVDPRIAAAYKRLTDRARWWASA